MEDGRLTVQDVLDLDPMVTWGAEVAACPGRLDRPVRWLHVAEATDVAVMLSGGEMVLTTGVLLAGDERRQVEYVEAMQRAEAAAVVLGLGRGFRTTPEAMRRAAERCRVPLIVLHRPAPFTRLTEEVHARLLHGRFAALDLSDRMSSALTALNLSGVPLQRLLDEISAYGGGPAVVVNLARRVLACAGPRTALGDLLRDWDLVSRQVAAMAGNSPVTLGPDGWIVARLEARGRQWGQLVLFGHPGTAQTARVIGTRAAEALALHHLLGERGRGWEEQAAEVLLTDLAAGTARPEDLLPRIRAAGLPAGRRTFVPLVLRPHGRVPGLRELVERQLADDGTAALTAWIRPDALAVLLSLPPGRDAEQEVRRLAVRLHERLAALGARAAAGAGFGCAVLDELSRSFVEAVHVADAALAGPPAGPVAWLRDVRLRGLVRLLRDDPQLQSFIVRELGPLLGRPDLLELLRGYLSTGRNKSLTAQHQHISRPALYRRLQGIEELLGTDLDDLEQLTSLYVALLAHDAQQDAGQDAPH
ncbi:PucR family transcriptional regulator [Kitasatospora sp. NPDC048540]|uniref:PucR family transcriptional regulator n=1 Tax=unclassified Kitasatospora TaxID=2633591 RepID=UPI00053B52E7|nr:PucR family transcriptional regulator [Kitasatospora sp. MBT63]